MSAGMERTNFSAPSSRSPKALGDFARVDRLGHRERRIFVPAVARVAADFGDQTFGREAGSFFDGGPDDGAERQVSLVDKYEIEHVAWRSAAAIALLVAISTICSL